MLSPNNTFATMQVGNYRINLHAISFIEIFPIDKDRAEPDYGVQIHFSTQQPHTTLIFKGRETIDFINRYDAAMGLI